MDIPNQNNILEAECVRLEGIIYHSYWGRIKGNSSSTGGGGGGAAAVD